MTDPLTITSAANPRIKALVRLRERSSERRATGCFLIESLRELRRALAAGFSCTELYTCPEHLGEQSSELEMISKQTGIRPVLLAPHVLEKVAYRENPRGFLAVMRARHTTLEQLQLNTPELIGVLSGLEKPGNVGAIARTADAAGCSALFIDSPTFDLFNPHCIRASTGALFGLPIVCDTADRLRDYLQAHHIVSIALTPEAQLTHLHLSMRGPVALVFGSEDRGLDDGWKSHADLCCSIPMLGSVADSLNVSVSAAVMLFEAMRQRIT